MSTNFYLKKHITSEDKKNLIDLINNDKMDEATDMMNELQECIHIGKRSSGWKFRWNCHDFKYFDPSKESLIEWLKTGGTIEDEYGNQYTFEEFWKENESFINDPNGYDNERWFTEGKQTWYGSDNTSTIEKYKQKYNINVNKYLEFYIDGLRFTLENNWF